MKPIDIARIIGLIIGAIGAIIIVLHFGLLPAAGILLLVGGNSLAGITGNENWKP